MNKYEGKLNVIGKVLLIHRKKKKLSKADVCKLVQLHGIDINRTQLYRIEKGEGIVKDFELIALCNVLDIDYNDEIKNLIE